MFKNHKLNFYKDKIIDTTNNSEVMMNWEYDIMKKTSELICENGGDILEIGFGMGIFANFVQKQNIKTHTIIEIHPQILDILYKWSKDKSNIRIIEGDWYENLNKLENYDGIFFDTFEEKNQNSIKFLLNFLKKDGIFSFYNSMYKDNYLNLKCDYNNIDISTVKNSYNNNKIYSIPIYRNNN